MQRQCGGCPLLHLDRGEELDTKATTVRDALINAGIQLPDASGIGGTRGPEVRTASDRTGYRNRLRIKVLDGRADFFNHSKRDGCPVIRADLWQAIEQLRKRSAEQPELLAGATHAEVRVGDVGPAIGLSISVGDGTPPPDLRGLASQLGPNWKLGLTGGAGNHCPELTYEIAGVETEVPITSFVQVNSSVNQLLVDEVIAVAMKVEASTFLDLFSGAGNFTLPLIRRGLSGVAAEMEGAAIASLADKAATMAEGHRLRTIVGDVRELLIRVELEPDSHNRLLPRSDLVIVDPPRAGLRHGHDALVSLVAERLVLVSCFPASLAADIAACVERGLRLESVVAFDMFPGTSHVETLAVLSATR